MFVRSTALALLCLVPPTAQAQHPPFNEIIAPLQQGAEALERGDTAAYLDGHAKWVKWTQVWWRDSSVTPALKGAFDPRQ